MNVPMLNERDEAKVCSAMMKVVRDEIVVLDHDLTTRTLDREEYLQKIGARQRLTKALGEMEKVYNRTYNV